MNIYKELKLDNAQKVLEYINQGDDVHILNPKSMTLLQLAIFSNNTDIINALLKKQINVDHKDYYGMTALGYAIKENKVEIVKLLMPYANVDFTTIDRQPIMQYLQRSDKYLHMYSIIQEEQRKNQLVNGQHKDKVKENEHVHKKRHRSRENSSHKKQRYSKDDSPVINGLVPSQSSRQKSNSPKSPRAQKSAEESLVVKRQAPKQPDFDIFETIELGENAPVLRYLKQGGCMDLTIDKKTNLLQHSCFYNNYFIAKILLDRGIEVNYVDEIQFTALSYAVMGGYAPLVKLLLSNHADIKMSKIAGRSVVEYAKDTNEEIYQLLKIHSQGVSQESQNYKPEEEWVSEEYQDYPIQDKLFEVEPFAMQDTSYAYSPEDPLFIFNLIDDNDLQGIRDYFLRHGTKQSIYNLDNQTPLIYAIANNCGCLVPTLIKSGLNINHVDDYGSNALGAAIANRQIRSIQNLTRQGARARTAKYHGQRQSIVPEMDQYYVTENLTDTYVAKVMGEIRRDQELLEDEYKACKATQVKNMGYPDQNEYTMAPRNSSAGFKRNKYVNGRFQSRERQNWDRSVIVS